MKRGEILRYLAETLSIQETLEKFPDITDDKLRKLLLEASAAFAPAAGHKPPVTPQLTFYIDGASRGNPGKAAIGVVILDREGCTISEIKRYIGETTNNMAEYQALIEALTEGKRLGGKDIQVFSDSELLVRQMNGIYKVRDSKLLDLYGEAKRLVSDLKGFKIDHISREKNSRADSLANQALDNHIKGV